MASVNYFFVLEIKKERTLFSEPTAGIEPATCSLRMSGYSLVLNVLPQSDSVSDSYTLIFCQLNISTCLGFKQGKVTNVFLAMCMP